MGRHSCFSVFYEDKIRPSIATHVCYNCHKIDGKAVPCSLVAHITEPS